jgi:hypothetical protein
MSRTLCRRQRECLILEERLPQPEEGVLQLALGAAARQIGGLSLQTLWIGGRRSGW